MTASIPRYVRVRRRWEIDHQALWWCAFCPYTREAAARRQWLPADVAMDRARRHGEGCESVRAAMERDHYRRTLESCEAAYAEATRTLRRQRNEAREGRDRLAESLAEASAENNRLSHEIDRLHADLERCRNLSFALIGEAAS